MHFNKKLVAVFSVFSVVIFIAMVSMVTVREYKNLKVLPKDISHEDLGKVMGKWSQSLGVHCNYCHARNEEIKKMDFVSDAKPEKETARHMFRMMQKINKKYFKAVKDSTGMINESGVTCFTCHRGSSHPETVIKLQGAK
jgi:hypothetical protein